MIFFKIDCQNTTILPFLSIVKNIMLLIQIIVPIILIISGIISFTNMLMNPDEKKELKKIFNKFLAAAIVFIIPLVVNLVIGLFGDISSFSSCWENADSFSFGSGSYQQTEEDKKEKSKPINSNTSNYEPSTGNVEGACLRTDKTTKVLFVGDSKTNTNGIPSKFAGISKANGYNVDVTKATKGAKTLEWLGNNYRSIITNGSYDCVVLQEQIDVYSDDYYTYLRGVRKIVSMVRGQNSNVKVYIRALWVLRDSDSKTKRKAYEQTELVANKTSCDVIYDGKAFDIFGETYPSSPLFKDIVHQNPTGAYLSAATIFKSLAGKTPTSTSYTGGISKNDAKKVFNIVAHN
ncbi:MAG: hypothetical protein IJ842_03095 [Bacilli bacterium]|nr:hypothetical protein [Bacilli bacterium]